MNARGTPYLDYEVISKKLGAVRLVQDLCREADSYWQIPEVLQRILRSLAEVLEFKHSMIYLLNDDGETLSFQSGWGYSDTHTDMQVKIGQGFIGMAALSGVAIRIGDMRKSLLYMRAIRARSSSSPLNIKLEEPRRMPGLTNPGSLMSVPLITKSGVIGVIVVESHLASAFDEIDQELLLLVAGQMARLIADSRRSESNRHWQTTSLQLQDICFQQLTKREREVAVLAAQGLPNGEIAERLYVSVRTVTTHLERIYAKLGICSRYALSRYTQYT
jgi:DNA-binding CsgD family transcriptional regulator